jgi:hypothetical protein
MGQLCPFFLSSLLYYKYLIVCSSIGPNNDQSTPEYSSLESESLRFAVDRYAAPVFCCDSEIASALWIFSSVTKPITAKQQGFAYFTFPTFQVSTLERDSVQCSVSHLVKIIYCSPGQNYRTRLDSRVHEELERRV